MTGRLVCRGSSSGKANKDAQGVYRAIGAPFAESTDALVTTDYDGVLEVLKGTHVFIKEKSYLDFAIEEDSNASGKYRLALAKSHFFPANFGWVFPEGDPLKVLFDKESSLAKNPKTLKESNPTAHVSLDPF
nr:uncharacterized protein LOC113827355 [Penaeus vannamei]